MKVVWKGKPVPSEWADMAIELAGEIDRLEAENARLKRGFTMGGARPPHTKPKQVEDYGRTAL